jgi:hypothetical protein
MGLAIDKLLEIKIDGALRDGMPHREAALQFGVSRTTVQRIADGRPARRKPLQTTGPYLVPSFDCPECHVVSIMKWDPADPGCFVCYVRKRMIAGEGSSPDSAY